MLLLSYYPALQESIFKFKLLIRIDCQEAKSEMSEINTDLLLLVIALVPLIRPYLINYLVINR